MILQALKAKLRQRGPLGFAADAGQLAIACGIVGVYELALAGVAIAAGLAATPAIVVEVLTGRRPHRCDADCATDRTSCRNAEEPS